MVPSMAPVFRSMVRSSHAVCRWIAGRTKGAASPGQERKPAQQNCSLAEKRQDSADHGDDPVGASGQNHGDQANSRQTGEPLVKSAGGLPVLPPQEQEQPEQNRGRLSRNLIEAKLSLIAGGNACMIKAQGQGKLPQDNYKEENP